jgi:hypothetical protein
MSHATAEGTPEQAEQARQVYNRTTSPLVLRNRAELGELMHGWNLLDPGITAGGEWHPDPHDPPTGEVASRSILAAVGRKP